MFLCLFFSKFLQIVQLHKVKNLKKKDHTVTFDVLLIKKEIKMWLFLLKNILSLRIEGSIIEHNEVQLCNPSISAHKWLIQI